MHYPRPIPPFPEFFTGHQLIIRAQRCTLRPGKEKREGNSFAPILEDERQNTLSLTMPPKRRCYQSNRTQAAQAGSLIHTALRWHDLLFETQETTHHGNIIANNPVFVKRNL
jgi:hypothetical protein